MTKNLLFNFLLISLFLLSTSCFNNDPENKRSSTSGQKQTETPNENDDDDNSNNDDADDDDNDNDTEGTSFSINDIKGDWDYMVECVPVGSNAATEQLGTLYQTAQIKITASSLIMYAVYYKSADCSTTRYIDIDVTTDLQLGSDVTNLNNTRNVDLTFKSAKVTPKDNGIVLMLNVLQLGDFTDWAVDTGKTITDLSTLGLVKLLFPGLTSNTIKNILQLTTTEKICFGSDIFASATRPTTIDTTSCFIK